MRETDLEKKAEEAIYQEDSARDLEDLKAQEGPEGPMDLEVEGIAKKKMMKFKINTLKEFPSRILEVEP